MNKSVLIVDDDASILTLISDVLCDEGFDVITASSGEDCLSLIKERGFDIIILDIMMKGISGFDVCRKIRGEVSCPIIFLSAKESSKDIIDGLSLGADDYLTKPFVTSELVARINAHLRREGRTKTSPENEIITIGGISANPLDMSVEKDSERISLSTKEFELLYYLMQNAGQTLSRERIFRDVWKTSYGDIGTVAINIKNLREKLDPSWEYIKTIWGSGYRFVSGSRLSDEKGI